MNYADSEKIHRILLQSGFMKTIDPTKADVVILNTCSVRQKWEDKVFGFIREIRNSDKLHNKKTIVGITGCMTRKTGIHKKYFDAEEIPSKQKVQNISLIGATGNIRNHDDPLFARTNDIDFIFRIEETGFLTKILSSIWKEEIWNDEKWEEYLKISQVPANSFQSNIIIQTGCDNFCTFCIVPYTRGREASRNKEEITQEVQSVVSSGAKEVTLLGQNVNSYGKLTKKKLWNEEELTWNREELSGEKTPFRELLEALWGTPWLDRLRFTSSNPHDMTRDILDAHFEIPALCPYLHFALQSWSDAVLKRMNRKHTYEDFRSQVEYLRSKNPDFSLSTDIIVGFPGETEDEFEQTRQAMIECEFDFAYIARYSVRNGTTSSKMDNPVSAEVKAKRWWILNEQLQISTAKRSERMLGKTEVILVTGKGKQGNWTGRTRNFKEVFIESEENLLGQLVPVRISRLDEWVLIGERL